LARHPGRYRRRHHYLRLLQLRRLCQWGQSCFTKDTSNTDMSLGFLIFSDAAPEDEASLFLTLLRP
jgi:hypothetical protein